MSTWIQSAFGFAAAIGMAGAAVAVPRESVQFQGVASEGAQDDPANTVLTATLTGGYTAYRIHVTATLHAVEPFTWGTDARLEITSPGGEQFILQPVAATHEFTTITLNDVIASLPLPASAGGEWTFRFFEAFQDAAVGPDAIWDSILLTLDDDEGAPPAVLQPVQNLYSEIEDNDRKSRANRILSLEPDQAITGMTTGDSSAPGLTSADYFRIRTAAAPPGIYRHELVTTSLTPGHTVTIRGCTQVDAVIDPATDIAVQSSYIADLSQRYNAWYGFGKQEEVFFRVAGTIGTSQPYVAAYRRTSVQPLVVPRTFRSGSLEINTSAMGHQTDTDLWVYDAAFNPIPGAGDDDAVGLSFGSSRYIGNFASGTYYVVIAPFNLANNLPSTYPGEIFRSGDVLDFAGAVARSTSAVQVPVDLSITDSLGREPVALTTGEGYFGLAFIRLDIGCPADLDDGTFTGTRDGAVDINDLLYFLAAYENGDVAADLDDGSATGHHDGAVTIDDLLYFLALFEQGC